MSKENEPYNLPSHEDKFLTEQEVRAIVSSSMENFAGNFRIKSGSIQDNDGSFEIDANGKVSNPVITGLQSGSEINGQYIDNLTIQTGALANLSITAGKIADATITATQIANATITGTQVASGTITSDNIENATITGTDIANATITGGKIAATTITASNIAAATITGTEIANATITGGKIDTATITGSNIAATTIQAGNIANATITTSQISGSAGITGGQIANATITTSQISNTAGIIGGQIDSLTITAGNIANLTITTSQIANATIVGGDIAADTITGGALGNIAAATITGTEIAATTIAAGNIVANTITASEIAAGAITATEITVSTLSALTADLGTITAGTITMPSTGWIKGGQTAYATGTGFFLGYETDAYKFSIGNATDYLKWNGSNIQMLCSSANAIHIQYGSDILLEHGGDIKFTSVTAPTACTAALIEVAGNVDAGTHKYKVTYVNASGETKLGTTSNTITNDGTHKQNSLTNIPTSSSGSVTSRRIYRTKAGGTDYYLLTTIADNTTTTYTDNTADASLTTQRYFYTQNDTFGKLFVDGIASLSLGKMNTFIGQESGKNNTSGHYNTASGYRSLNSNTTGRGNSAIGYKSLSSNITGDYNTAIGHYSLLYNTTGYYNTAIGGNSLFSVTTGYENTAIGYNSLYTNSAGYYNTAIGYRSLNSNRPTGEAISEFEDYDATVAGTIRATSVAHGLSGSVSSIRISGTTDYDGIYTITVIDVDTFYFTNTWVDNQSATAWWSKDSEGRHNTALGYYSGYRNETGSKNIFLGYNAGYYETGSDKLFIDNSPRTNEATARTSAMIYGVFNSTATDQTLRLTASVGINTADFGSGKVVLALANASTVPSANPTGGGVIYCEGGALKYRGSSGTITTIANA